VPEELKKRLDADTRQRLEAIQAGYEKWTRRTIWILRALVVATLALGVVSILLIGANSERVDEIQQSRVDITRQTCEAQNDRNAKTVRAYDVRIAAARTSGQLTREQIARLQESRAFTVALIDSLAPRQDCAQLIRERFAK
jgi:hypothetical protein